jgi:aryl-alcohol dehydrogenase-like predicted oxidoreductase
MKKIRLGKTGLEVASLCLGTDSIGSKIDSKKSFELLDLYFESGGNFIDTANIYAAFLEGFHGGESETTIGSWLKERGVRDRIILSTKTGFPYPGFAGGLSANVIRQECEASLRRLQTDRLDIYCAHCDDPDTPQRETMDAFNTLIKEGKVRAIAASNLPVWRIARANTICEENGLQPYSIVQQRYTYLRPRHGADFGPQICIGEELKDYARKNDISLIGYSVLLQGAYHREDRPLPNQYGGSDADARLVELQTIASEVGATVNQVVLAWMLQSNPRVLPIVAGSRTDQLEESIGALTVSLTADQMAKLETAGNPNVKQTWLIPQ